MCSATSAGTDGSTMRSSMASCMWAAHWPLLPSSQRGARPKSSDLLEHSLPCRCRVNRDPFVPQIRRHAAEEKGPAGAEDQACIDLRRVAEDAFVEQVADLVRHRLEDVTRDLFDGLRRVL